MRTIPYVCYESLFLILFNFFSSSLRSERLVKIEELDWTVCPYTYIYTVYVYPRPILFLLAMIPDYFSCSMSPNVSSTLLYLSPPFRGKNKDRATQLNRRETRKWQRINIEEVCEPLKDERKDIERKRKREKKNGFSAIELLLQPIGFVYLNALDGTWSFFGLLLSRCPSIVSLVLSIFWPLEILSNFFHVVCIARRGSKANSAIFFGRGHPGATTGQIMLR